jgi:hypothetical protein
MVNNFLFEEVAKDAMKLKFVPIELYWPVMGSSRSMERMA